LPVPPVNTMRLPDMDFDPWLLRRLLKARARGRR
jgi:hypothetical protein